MKEIIINEANKGKINAAIEAVQARASVRRIEGYDELVSIIKLVERKIGSIPKTARQGCRIIIDNATALAKSYKYPASAQATQAELVYNRGSWRLVSVCRDTVPNRRSKPYWHTQITEAARDAIIKRMDLDVIGNAD